MWLALSFLSAFCLGFYDIFKKISLKANNVLLVLFLNTEKNGAEQIAYLPVPEVKFVSFHKCGFYVSYIFN